MPLEINVNKIGGALPAQPAAKSSAPIWLDRAADELGQASVSRNVVNVARRGLQLANQASSPDTNRQLAVTHFETFSDVLQVLGIVSSIRTLFVESKRTFSKDPEKAASEKKVRNLTVASNVFGVALGTLSGVKLLSRFGAVNLSEIAKSMGNFQVVSGGFAVFPLGSFISVLEIAQAGLDIAVAVEKIKNINTSNSRAGGKTHFWSGPLTTKSIENRITHLKKAKMKDLEEDAKEFASQAKQLVKKVQKIEQTQKQLRIALNSKKRLKFLQAHKLRTLEKKKRKLIKSQHAKCEEVEKRKAAYEKLEKKVTEWGKIKQAIEGGALSEKVRNQIEQFQAKKIEKWNVKKENLKLEKKKTGLTIAHRTVVIIALIASIVISATGIGFIPILITMTSIALFITLSGLGLRLYQKYKTGKPVTAVQMPKLELA